MLAIQHQAHTAATVLMLTLRASGQAPEVSGRAAPRPPNPFAATQGGEFVREVFDRITLEGPQVKALTPKTLYAPLFVLDRQERFSGVMVGVEWLRELVSEQRY